MRRRKTERFFAKREGRSVGQVENGISESLLNRFRQTLNYGFEDTYVSEQNAFEKAMRDDFFLSFYVPRPSDEEVIEAWMTHHANDLGQVVGVQGCGKSTLMKRMRNLISQELYPTIYVNVRNIWGNMRGTSTEHWGDVLNTAIKGHLTERFFKKERINHYFVNLLYDEYTAEETFVDERNEINWLHTQSLTKEVGEDNPRIMEERAWFAKHQFDAGRVGEICKSISGKLTLKHYIIAARLVAPHIVHFVIIIDNVDCVPRNDQCHLYQIAEEIRTVHMTASNVVIVTRKETCHPPNGVINVNASPITNLGFYTPEAEEKAPTALEFSIILKKRLDFFLTKNEADGDATRTLVDLSDSLRQMYVEGSILQRLSNQSIRDALQYHCDFLRDLLKSYTLDQLKQVFNAPYGKKVVLSSLYGWLTKYGEVLKSQHLNLPVLLHYCKERRFVGTKGCDVSYLILACVHNFRHNRGRNPRVHETIALFSPLGYSSAEILEALCNLWNLHKIDFGQVISLYQQPLPESFEQITPNAEIELNYRGEALLRVVSVSFMFTARLLYDMHMESFYRKSDRERVSRFYDIGNVPIHLWNITRFLFELADLHTLELHKIRTGYNTDDWLIRYLRDFGVNRRLLRIPMQTGHPFRSKPAAQYD